MQSLEPITSFMFLCLQGFDLYLELPVNILSKAKTQTDFDNQKFRWRYQRLLKNIFPESVINKTVYFIILLA